MFHDDNSVDIVISREIGHVDGINNKSTSLSIVRSVTILNGHHNRRVCGVYAKNVIWNLLSFDVFFLQVPLFNIVFTIARVQQWNAAKCVRKHIPIVSAAYV